MTETEATYTTEPLPECETGSVEQMLEAAVVWHCKIWAAGKMRDEKETGLIISQKLLLGNILAKMRDGQEPPGKEWIRSRMTIGQCPSCDARLVMAVRVIGTPTDG